MPNKWQQATLDALHRFSKHHRSRLIRRRDLIREELPAIVSAIGSKGVTPRYTLSRTLQELRRLGILHHVDRGVDLLLDTPIVAEDEDYPDKALDVAIKCEQFQIGDLPTGDATRLARFRRGQSKLREHTLANYEHRCGLCDVGAANLLVASHIARWSDDTAARGRLSNLLCLCRMHDALFEYGYVSIADDFNLLVKSNVKCRVVAFLQRTSGQLRLPKAHPPSIEYLRQHRRRTRFETD
jgi:hypothetical protein